MTIGWLQGGLGSQTTWTQIPGTNSPCALVSVLMENENSNRTCVMGLLGGSEELTRGKPADYASGGELLRGRGVEEKANAS